MAKKNGQGESESKASTVRMRAPKGTAAVGVPMGNAVIEVRVPKSGVVDVDPSLTGKLVEAGFEIVNKKDDED